MVASLIPAFGTPASSFFAFIGLYFAFALVSLFQNVRAAKATGITYTIAPVHISNKLWLGLQKLLLPILHQAPNWMTESWLPLSVYDQTWRHGFAPFKYHKSTNILVVSPFKLVLWTCNPTTILDVSRRRNDVLKPIEELEILNVHGPTVTSSDGEQARRYRKVTTSCFGQYMYEGAWDKGINRAGTFTKRLLSSAEHLGRVKKELELLTFAVVSEVCFGIPSTPDGDMVLQRHMPHKGKLSYWESFAISAEYMAVTYMTPKGILKISPLEMHKIAHTSNTEWRNYMEDMILEKKLEREAGIVPRKPNLLDSLYSASLDLNVKLEHEAILGNIWVFVLGGFHTSSNTLHFILILLSIYPSLQRTLQQSIDKTSEGRDPSTWSHAVDFPAFLNGHVGAVVAETLRCFGVLPWIPKTTGDAPTSLMVDQTDGSKHQTILPPHTLVLVNTSAVHRNPAYWPQKEAVITGDIEPYAASGWDPWRWLKNKDQKTSTTQLESDDTELTSLMTSAWQPGTYIPFSDGARACIGKRFAQTELCAILARIMKECSVELAVTGGEEQWIRARGEASRKLSQNVGITLALELKAEVPLVFVPRGKERWIDSDLVDSMT